jgi:hypothetical protein
MANINDIESLFSLIGQSPNDYKEFYHEKNGLHALDKWSYLKNIQLENPNEEGISIFENGPMNPNPSVKVEKSPLTNSTNTELNTVTRATPTNQDQDFTPREVVVSSPKVERYTSPVLESTSDFSNISDESQTQSSTFSDSDVRPLTSDPLDVPEPLTPQIYNPASAPQVVSPPPAPKVYSTSSIPSVPSFRPNFTNPMNAATTSTFTSSFVKPTAQVNSNLQSTFTPSRIDTPTNSSSVNQTEEKSSTQNASPLNSIFSRLEQK